MCNALEDVALAEQLVGKLGLERRNVVEAALLDGQIAWQRSSESALFRRAYLIFLVALQQTRHVVVNGELRDGD